MRALFPPFPSSFSFISNKASSIKIARPSSDTEDPEEERVDNVTRYLPRNGRVSHFWYLSVYLFFDRDKMFSKETRNDVDD